MNKLSQDMDIVYQKKLEYIASDQIYYSICGSLKLSFMSSYMLLIVY